MMKRSSPSFRNHRLTAALGVTLLAWAIAGPSPSLALEEAAQIPPESASPIPSRESWSELMREARELRRLGNLREAEARLLEAIAIGDHHGPPGQRAATAFYQLNRIGDYYEARNQQDDILRLGPTLVLLGSQILGPSDPSVRRHREALVGALTASGDEAAAQEALEGAIATSVGTERFRYQLALAARAIQGTQPDDAEPVLTSLLEEIPSDGSDRQAQAARVAALQLMGELREAQLREDEAEPLFLEAVAKASASAPNSALEARAKNALASFYVEQDRSDAADPLAREALVAAEAQANSELLQVEILDTLASSLARQERAEEAEDTYRRGLDLADQQSGAVVETLRSHYADWLRSRGRGAEADAVVPPTADSSTQDPAPAG